MTDAALSRPRSTVAGNPWLVAAVVVVPTFMEALDTTIAVVALRYIVGGLSATAADGEWVLTSYLAVLRQLLDVRRVDVRGRVRRTVYETFCG
jgi:MFS transporter, DHA2 family, multidrug resistance protein